MKRFALILAFVAASAAAQEPTWFDAGTTDAGYKFAMKAGSFVVDRNANNVEYIGALVRVIRPNGEMAFRQVVMGTDACAQGYGELIHAPVNNTGPEGQTRAQWVRDGGNINSTLGEFLCAYYKGVQMRRNERKGNT